MSLDEVVNLVNDMIDDYGIPRNIRSTLEESLSYLNNTETEHEKVAFIISILDDASNDPNVSLYARTKIWNVVSLLETLQK